MTPFALTRRLGRLAVVVAALSPCAAAAAPPTFGADVLPILRAKCVNCHGADDPKGDLDVRTRAALLKGGETGPAIRPGGPGHGPLWDQVRTDTMPPGKAAKLTAAEKDTVRAWIEAGAPDGGTAAEATARVVPFVPGDAARPRAAVTADVDRLVDANLAVAKVPPSPPADDAEFLRRVTLDLVGRVPTADRARAFLDDPSPDKRSRLIDELLASPEFGRHLGQLWHNRIVPLDANNQRRFDESLFLWLAGKLNANRPWSETVAELLTAEGELVTNRNREPSPVPAIGFFLASAEEEYVQPDKVTAAAAHLFLGVQLQCAQCHNHPFARWKQDDFWGLAAFFARVGYDGDIAQIRQKKQTVVLKETVKAAMKGGKPSSFVRADASIEVPESKGRVVKAKFLDGAEPPLKADGRFLPSFAGWATAKENRLFAAAGANRVWAQLFGRGLVNPVNDLHDGNPPSHPELFDLLAREFAASGHDLKHLYRCLCHTAAYQRTSRPLPANKGDAALYSHAPLKMMTAEVLYDSALIVFRGADAALEKELIPVAAGGRSIRDAGRSQFLNAVTSQEAGEDATRYTHGVSQALKFMNSQSIVRDGPLMKSLSARGKPNAADVERLYLAALARRPTADEAKLWEDFLAAEKDTGRAYRNVVWVLLNGSEFVFNH